MVVLEPKEAPPLHVHHDTEQVFYVMRGAGTLYIGAGASQRFRVRRETWCASLRTRFTVFGQAARNGLFI